MKNNGNFLSKSLEYAKDYDPYGNIGVNIAKEKTKSKTSEVIEEKENNSQKVSSHNIALQKTDSIHLPQNIIAVKTNNIEVVGNISIQRSGYCKYRRLDSYNRESGIFYASEELLTLEKYNPGKIKKENSIKNSYEFIVDTGITTLPFFDFCKIDIDKLPKHIELFIDNSGTIYIKNMSNKQEDISLDFYEGQEQLIKQPNKNETEKLLEGVEITTSTNELINNMKSSKINISEKLEEVSRYIRGKTNYSLSAQGKIFYDDIDKNYLSKLDKQEKLDCTSAAKLCLVILREIGIPCRLCSGYPIGHNNHIVKYGNGYEPIQSKTCINASDSHMFIEAYDVENKIWLNVDATPSKEKTESDNGSHIDNLIKSRVMDFFVNGNFDIFPVGIGDFYSTLLEFLTVGVFFTHDNYDYKEYIKNTPQSIQLMILDSLRIQKEGNGTYLKMPLEIQNIYFKVIGKYKTNENNNYGRDMGFGF